MIKLEKTVLAITMSTLVLLSSCAKKEPTFGDNLVQSGDEVHKIGEQWSEGERLNNKGKDLIGLGDKEIKKGGDLIAQGQSNIHKGKELISEGNLLETDAEIKYYNKVQNPVMNK